VAEEGARLVAEVEKDVPREEEEEEAEEAVEEAAEEAVEEVEVVIAVVVVVVVAGAVAVPSVGSGFSSGASVVVVDSSGAPVGTIAFGFGVGPATTSAQHTK